MYNSTSTLITKTYFALLRSLVCIALFITLFPGCSIYKKDIRQGNQVTQENINKLRSGMSKDQVQDIMGSPALIPIINLSPWDYYYSFKPGDNGRLEEKSFSLYFKQNKLRYYSGDWQPAHLKRKSN